MIPPCGHGGATLGSLRPLIGPLMLISPASDKRISSTLGDLMASRRTPPLLMNPRDVDPRNLAHGADVRVQELDASSAPVAAEGRAADVLAVLLGRRQPADPAFAAAFPGP